MALQEVNYQSIGYAYPEEGIITFSKDGEIVSHLNTKDEAAGADLLILNLASYLWDINKDTGDIDQSKAPKGITDWIEYMLTAESEQQQITRSGKKIQNSELPELFEKVYGDGDNDRKWSDLGFAETYIRDVLLTLSSSSTEIYLPEITTADGTPDALVNPDFFNTASLFVGSENAQTVYGNNANTVFLMGEEDDIVYLSQRKFDQSGTFPGGGQDIVFGRQGICFCAKGLRRRVLTRVDPFRSNLNTSGS